MTLILLAVFFLPVIVLLLLVAGSTYERHLEHKEIMAGKREVPVYDDED